MVNEHTPVASPGEVFAATREVLRMRTAPLIAAMTFLAIPGSVITLLPKLMGWDEGPLNPAYFALLLAGILVSLPFGFTVVPIVVGARSGPGMGFLEALGEFGARWPRALWATVLVTLGVLGGMILLIVPGLVLAVRWAFYPPILMLHPVSARRSLKLSADFVRGRAWRIVGHLFLMVFLPILALSLFSGMVMGFMTRFVEGASGGGIDLGALLELFLTLPQVVLTTVAYVYVTCLFLLSGGETESLDIDLPPLRPVMPEATPVVTL